MKQRSMALAKVTAGSNSCELVCVRALVSRTVSIQQYFQDDCNIIGLEYNSVQDLFNCNFNCNPLLPQ